MAPTALDEALLSAMSLALAMALIRGGSKAEYGVFSLVSGVVLLMRGVQNSLVLVPLATIGGRLRGGERTSWVRAMSQLQVGLGAVLALALTGGVWIYAGKASWLLAVGAGLTLAGGWLREYRRAVAVLDERGGAALAGDTLFALLGLGAVLALWAGSETLSAGGVLAATGVAAGVAAGVGFPRLSGPVAPASGRRRVARVALEQARWSLPGTAVAWGQSSGYAVAVGLVLDAAAVGEIAAARLFVVPLLLVGVAWSRLFVPRAAALLADGGEAVLLARCGQALRIALVASGLFVAVLAAAFALGLGRILPADYATCEVQALAWAGFASTSLCRSIASNALIARLEFRPLFVMTVVSAVASLSLVVVLIAPLGEIGAILGLAGGELLMAILCWRALMAGRGR